MLFMCVTTSEPVNGNETMRKRLEKGRMFPGGVKVLGEWTVLSGAGGFMLVESNDPKALMDAARAWADVAKIEPFPVISAGKSCRRSSRDRLQRNMGCERRLFRRRGSQKKDLRQSELFPPTERRPPVLFHQTFKAKAGFGHEDQKKVGEEGTP